MEMRRHILFIVENAPAPYDVRVWAEAKTAKKVGYEVSIISPKNEMASGKYQKLEGIEIYRHSEPKNASGIRSFIFELINALFWEFLLSIRIYRKKPFQLIHAANPPDHIFLIALLFKPFGVKFIFDHHDLAPELYLTKFSNKKNIIYKILLLFEKFSCKCADAIVSTNTSYKDIVVSRHSVNPKNVFVVRNDPVYKEFFDYSQKYKKINAIQNGKAKLLFLGSINKQDGIDVLLSALYYLKNHHNNKNFICNILGQGDSFEFAKQLTVELELENFVNFTGWIFDKDKVREYLYSSDICVEPAPYNEINNHSTFIKIMQYMAAGKPIVAFDLNETRYSTNRNAELVEPYDIKGFAQAIKKMIDNPILREKLGESAKKRIETELNWQVAARNLKTAYKSIYD